MPIKTALGEGSAELYLHTGLRDLWVQPVWSLSFLTSLLPLFPHLVCPIVSVPRLGGGRFRILSPDRIIQQGEEPVPSSSSRPGLFLALDKPLPSSGPQLPSL